MQNEVESASSALHETIAYLTENMFKITCVANKRARDIDVLCHKVASATADSIGKYADSMDKLTASDVDDLLVFVVLETRRITEKALGFNQPGEDV